MNKNTMNKKIRKQMIDFLDQTLSKSNVLNYKYVDFDGDSDVNFIVIPKVDTKKLKEDIQLQLIIYCSDQESLSIYCPLMYKLGEKDSSMFALNAINEVNNKIAVGKIYLNQNNNSVISYIYRALFNNIFGELTPELINDYIDAFLLTSIEFYVKMKEVLHEDK